MGRNDSPESAFNVYDDEFFGDLFIPQEDAYPGKLLVFFSDSDGRFEFSQMFARLLNEHDLTVLAIAYVNQEGLPAEFGRVPIDTPKAAISETKAPDAVSQRYRSETGIPMPAWNELRSLGKPNVVSAFTIEKGTDNEVL